MGFLLIATLVTQPIAAAYFFIYLTDWTALVFVVYLVVAFVNVVLDRKHGKGFHHAPVGDVPVVGGYNGYFFKLNFSRFSI